MRLLLRAWRLRQTARDALLHGDVERARALASHAERVHQTPRGASLRLLCDWLTAPAAPADPGSLERRE